MGLGPLEFVVIGVQDGHGMDEIIPALSAIEESGALRVRDLLVVRTDTTGAVTMQEVSELAGGDDAAEEDAGDDASGAAGTAPAAGVLSAADVQTLAAQMPAAATAVVVLLEHLWAQELTAAVQRAGGVLYTGGLVAPEALAQVEAEWAPAEAVEAVGATEMAPTP